MSGSRIAVIGSREFTDYAVMEAVLNSFLETCKWPVVLVSGGARGADNLAERYAAENKIPIHIIRADWNAYGKAAGFLRNTKIVEACDDCVAFWDGKSSGTADTIRKFRELKGIFPLIVEF